MKRQALDILQAVLFESADRLHTNPARSWKTIQQRVEHEGESFLTITLPALHDHLLSCIDQEVWTPNRLWKESKGSPVFLQEFLGFVFDFAGDVPLLKNDDLTVLAVRSLRQILGLFGKKFELPSDKRSKAAVDSFFKLEEELRESRKRIHGALDRDFRLVTEVLFQPVFSKSQKDLDALDFRHGPGSTADRAFGIPKYSAVKAGWTSRLDRVFDVGQVAYLNYSDLADSPRHSMIPPKHEPSMKVVLVPKTAKTPRTIAMEPTVMQWVQQGILASLSLRVSESEYSRNCSWNDQTRNRELAKLGSVDRSLATLDLSEASDRLHLSVVSFMLKNYPSLRRAVFACRTTTANFEGRVSRLEKFAPMGSAMCFAFESMAFYAMAVLGVARSRRGTSHIRVSDVTNAASNVSVYGDDIIVPTDCALSVVDCLESFGLKVNRRKSFWTGEFRESCGGDFFRGHDVSIARVRRDVSYNRKELEDWASTVELQNRLHEKGYYRTAASMANVLRSHGLATAPPGERPGLWLFGDCYDGKNRYNTHLQRWEYRTLSLVFSSGSGDVTGYDMLFHWFRSSSVPSERCIVPLVRRPHLVRVRFIYCPVTTGMALD